MKWFCFLCYFIVFQAVHAQVVINELLPANRNTNKDGFGEADDWVEIYNPTDQPYDLGGWFITDDLSKPTKHRISDVRPHWSTVHPKSYVLLWLDGDPEQGIRHIDFSLSKAGGEFAIFDPDTNLVDHLRYSRQKQDVSWGRLTDGVPETALFSQPTPNQPNVAGLRIPPQDAAVNFLNEEGFYPSGISLTMETKFSGFIHYTLDGSEPDAKAPKYQAPLAIDSTCVVRARVIHEGYAPITPIATKSYFIGEKSTLPVLSLICDPTHLWHKKRGIYTNYEKPDWERPAHVAYFDFNPEHELKVAFDKSVDIKIAGNTSRRQPKKSFTIMANATDGKDRIDYPIFKDKDISSFGSIWVRADATSGRNVTELWVGERFKNELLFEVNQQMNGKVDMQAYEPVQLYLNGKYWGLYNLMERKGSDFIRNNHPVGKIDLLKGEETRKVSGSAKEYEAFLAFVSMNNPVSDPIYKTICKKMDVESYIDYWVNETYCNARDIRVNIRYWKERTPGHKWRWISFDQDSWGRADDHSLKTYIDEGKVFLLGRLMKNASFQKQFMNRMCDYLNTGFKTENVIALVDCITQRIASEVVLDRERWQDSMLYVKPGYRINWIKEFAAARPAILRQQMLSYFNLEGKETEIKVCTGKEGGGRVRVNSLMIVDQEAYWTGIYLGDLPIRVEAIPDEGYRFVRWKNKRLGTAASLEVLPQKHRKFVPVFERITTVHPES